MEACWEYLGCRTEDCVIYGKTGIKYCWEVEGTLCNHHGIELMQRSLGGKKEDACAHSACIYYKAAKDRAKFG